MDNVLADLGTQLTSGFEAIKNSVEHFSLVQDSVTQAIKARDEARLALAKTLDDLEGAIRQARVKLELDAQPAHTDPNPPAEAGDVPADNPPK